MSAARRDRKTGALALAALLALGGAGRASESYYMIVFSYQKEFYRPALTHTFGAFVKVTEDETDPGRCHLHCRAISWLPENKEVRLHCLWPERGRNWALETTLDLAVERGCRISQWGPYQIEKELYDRAIRHINYLERERPRYKAIDTGFPAGFACNCIHALSDVSDGRGRLRLWSPGWGDPASYRVVRRLKRFIINPGETHDWIAECLGLHNYPIRKRDLDDPVRFFSLR